MRKSINFLSRLMCIMLVGVMVALLLPVPMIQVQANIIVQDAIFSTNGKHALAILGDNSLWAWGDNTFGQLGDGTTIQRNSPVKIMDDVARVFAHSNHTFAIARNGSVYAWGNNQYGQLGTGDRNNRHTPTPIIPGGIREIIPNFSHTLAIDINGRLVAWGDNLSGQLGLGGVLGNDFLLPNFGVLLPAGIPVLQAVTHANHNLAILSDNSLWVWGQNDSGQLGIGATATPVYTPVDVRFANGWFANATNGDTGSTPPVPYADPSVSAADPVLIATATGYSIAVAGLDPNGPSDPDYLGGEFVAWGVNNVGQFGNGSTNNNISLPINAGVPGGSPGPNFRAIVAHDTRVFAINQSNDLFAWGVNGGRLGDGFSPNINRIDNGFIIPDVRTISTGSDHTLVLLTNNSVVSWGLNAQGQVGNGLYTTVPAPITTLRFGAYNTNNIRSIDANLNSSLAIHQTQTLWTWGENDRGQLGIGHTNNMPTPTQVLFQVGDPPLGTPGGHFDIQDLWELLTGSAAPMSFFHNSNEILFFSNGIVQSSLGNSGTWYADGPGQFFIIDNAGTRFNFRYTVIGTTLTITDSAGNQSVWTRPSPTPPPSPSPFPTPTPEPTPSPWEPPTPSPSPWEPPTQTPTPTPTWTPPPTTPTPPPPPPVVTLLSTGTFDAGGIIIPNPFMNVTGGGLVAFRAIGHILRWDIDFNRSGVGAMWASFTSPDNQTTIRVTNGQNHAVVNGQTVPMRNAMGDLVAARIVNDRFYVPLRFFEEYTPVRIDWFPGPPQGVNVQVLTPQFGGGNTGGGGSIAPGANTLEQRVFELVNIERRNHGLSELVWDNRLGNAARAHSEDMARNNYFDHTGRDGSSHRDRIARAGLTSVGITGENIAMGQTTPEAVMQSWMNSPGHRANILNPNVNHVGVGFDSNRWTQKFAEIISW